MIGPFPEALAVVGLGLMGGSLAKAVRRASPGTRIVGVEARAEGREEARAAGAVDEALEGPGSALARCDLAVLCTPVAAIEALLGPVSALLPDGAVLSDVGGAKERVLAAARRDVRGGVRFVGTHPMFGGHGGFASSSAEKWRDGVVAVCTDGDPSAVEVVESLHRALGARVERCTAAEHDEAVAMVSHLPYLVASALARATQEAGPLAARLAGPGLRDMTRLAAFPFDIQGEVARRNDHLPAAAKRLGHHLGALLAAIADSPAAAREALEAARAAREELLTGPLTCRRKGPLRGTVEVQGDKSISHRALLLGALAESETRVRGLLEAEDVSSTRCAVEALGATVREENGEIVVTPPARLFEPGDVIDCGNSGTSLRLLAGVLAGVPGLSVLTGDASLRRRPVRRVIEPLRRMGATLSAREGDRLPPLVVRGGALHGTRHVLEVASAQVKSAILLAGLSAEGETTVVEPERSRDHTERMLEGMGVPVRVSGNEVTLAPGRPRGGRVDVPGDVSSAAFFLCAAAGVPGSEVTVRAMGTNPTRTGFLEVLEAMGADVALANERTVAGEPRADVSVRASDLRAAEIRGALVPRLIDELPVLMVLATQARGKTVIRDAKELRVKESDRLAAMGESLAAAGARIELFEDGCAILGPTRLRGLAVKTRLDHRIAMSMAVAQLFTEGDEVELDDVACVGTSFPSFFELLDRLCGRPT